MDNQEALKRSKLIQDELYATKRFLSNYTDKRKNMTMIQAFDNITADDESQEKLPEVIQQINSYEMMLIPLLGDIEEEIRNKLFLNEFKLKRTVKKIILASREYYEANSWKLFKNSDILFCYFYGKQNVDNMVEKATGEKIVSLSIHNKPK